VKALITGATGFIGGSLASFLVEAGWDISILIRPGSHSRLAHPERFRIIEGNLSQPDDVFGVVSKLSVDVVVHAAAIRNRWGTPPSAYHAVNVAATQALLDATIGRAKRFVYLSSVGVFGRPGVLKIDESFPIRVSSHWDYHSSKAAGEQATLEHREQIETVVVRPTITYGPGDTDGMVTRLIQMMSSRHFFRIGQGDNHVHLTYIDDLVNGLYLAMTRPQASGGTFILAGPEPIKIKNLLTLIEQQTQCHLPKWYIPATPTRLLGTACEMFFHLLPRNWSPPITRDKVDNLCANRGFSSAKAIHELGYQPQWDYPMGIRHTLEWIHTL
jgi:nucleoside-diphosphate-sugar epimerase